MGLSVSTELLPALARGALVITGNERTARSLRRGWDLHHAGLGQRSWESARTLSWRSWMAALWRRLLLDGGSSAVLMNRAQERYLWLRILAEDRSASSLRGRAALADLMAHSWQRLCSYNGQGRLRRLAPNLQGDPASFARWARAFNELCGREALLSEAALEAELTRVLRTGVLQTEQREICLVGFDRFTPAQDTFLQSLRAKGAVLLRHDLEAASAGHIVSARDEAEEMRGAARWMHRLLEQDPAATLGLIVPDLARELPTLESTLREVLAPELQAITASSDAAPYEFSLGRPLAHEPLVQSARDLLRWACGPLPLETISRLLLSPFFSGGNAQEAHRRAALDVGPLRSQLRLQPQATISDIREDLRRTGNSLSTLDRLLGKLEAAQSRLNGGEARGFGEWAERFRRWLDVAQWAQPTSGLSSREYQVRQRWQEALDTVATLDFSGNRVEADEFLKSLESVVQETIFAPESRATPVQVMGPLEAAGSLFDGLWVMRCGDLSWPPKTASDPLLPRALQQELGMPGSAVAMDRATAEHLSARLAASGTAVVFSYAHHTPLRGLQRASSVLRSLALDEIMLDHLLPSPKPSTPTPLERTEDQTALPALPETTHRGGTRVLQLQAACGFRAFAEMRLGASSREERTLGLSVRERGSIVHDALESFWSKVSGQRELRAMSQDQRVTAVEMAVEKSLEGVLRLTRTAWDRAYLETQRLRLIRLLNDWLAVELRRPEFSVMTREEKRTNVTVGPLRLSVRMDRVDLVDGQQVVLDYKTGAAETSAWLGDRPDQPQVPLYAILAQQASSVGKAAPLGAVGFAQIRAGKDMKLRGFETEPGILMTSSARSRSTMDADSLPAQVIRWQDVLEQLAVHFAAGDAQVRPKQYPSTCQRCGQRLLCRLDASTFEEHPDDDHASADDYADE